MKNTPIRTMFVVTLVCAILLPFFAFFSVQSANAEETGDFTVRTPTFQLPPEPELDLGISKEELIELSPEIKRLDQQYNEAKPNEEIAGPVLDPIEKSVPGCGIADWLKPATAPLCAIYAAIRGVARLMGWTILPLASAFFEKLVDINLDNGETALFASAFVNIGWGISRDVANMFFIFFVLWMALATIFQFESYSAKRLLPKLIVVALLVNFSLPIGTFFIRTTNAIASVFHKAAKGNSSLTAQIMNVAAVHKAYNSQSPNEKVSAEIKPNSELDAVCNPTITKRVTDSILNSLLGTNFGNANKKASPGQIAHAKYVLRLTDETTMNLTTQAAICSIYNTKRGNNPGELVTMALMASIWQIIISLIASFVFFAGGIFLLVRSISLATLLVFGPLAFLFMILPATQEHWNKWWTKLTQWSFFAPAFMFMLMLSLRSASSLFNVYVAQQVGPLTMSDSVGLGVQFLMISGLLVASLFVAQSMGIWMSGTVVGWGRSMARGAGKYAKGASFRGAARMGGAYAKMALETPQARRMAATPLVRGLLRPLEAAVGAKRGVEEERAKQIANAVRSGNPAYAAARLQGERATVQAAYLRSASKDDIQKLEQGMGAGAMGVMMNQLKSIAPELGKKIGQSFKDIDLRIAAAKGVAIGTPEFERAREEYMSEQTPYALGQILTAENLQKQWVQKYLLARGGEKEINAITQTGEQIRGLASIFEQWGDAEMRNNTQLGNEIRQNIAMGQSFGYSPEQARRETMISYLPELFEKQAQQMGIATNQALQKWAQAAPARVMLGEGRVIQRGTDMDELLRRLSGGGGTAPQSPPPGGPATQ